MDRINKVRASLITQHASSLSSSGSWNIFRLSADLVHLASIFFLGTKISKSRSCAGILFNIRNIAEESSFISSCLRVSLS